MKLKVRCRVEDIFGSQKMRMGNEILRSNWFCQGAILDWDAEFDVQHETIAEFETPEEIESKVPATGEMRGGTCVPT